MKETPLMDEGTSGRMEVWGEGRERTKWEKIWEHQATNWNHSRDDLDLPLQSFREDRTTGAAVEVDCDLAAWTLYVWARTPSSPLH